MAARHRGNHSDDDDQDLKALLDSVDNNNKTDDPPTFLCCSNRFLGTSLGIGIVVVVFWILATNNDRPPAPVHQGIGGARNYLNQNSPPAPVPKTESDTVPRPVPQPDPIPKPDETSPPTQSPTMKLPAVPKTLQVATWNIAAINNNPFEYWITYKEEPKYEKLMVDIENFLENPGENDVLIPEVFTQDMFDKLDSRLTETANWTSVKSYWEDDFSKRTIISGFIKDKELGSKRLASMPDRVTNTIHTEDGVVFRPTVINMYEDDLSTNEIWWQQWETFLFDTPLRLKDKEGQVHENHVYELLQPIKKSKYPDITDQEAADSLPLQTMCGAIFDAILVHMMNKVSEPSVWQDLKATMVENLNKKKVPHTLEILEQQYLDSDIIMLQEVSSSFIDTAKSGPIGEKFTVISPEGLDVARDQNSVICLNKDRFDGDYLELSEDVSAAFPEGAEVPVADGDILAIEAEAKDGEKYVLASFHGDTNGLATIPVTDAMVKMMEERQLSNHKFIFGLDANTYEHATPKQQDVLKYEEGFLAHDLASCWGTVNPSNYTTFNARTYLQPQLNKACKQSEKREKGDVNPKDFILFPKAAFTVKRTWKDNTGKREYLEDTAFPTLSFPSDHGILATILEQQEQ